MVYDLLTFLLFTKQKKKKKRNPTNQKSLFYKTTILTTKTFLDSGYNSEDYRNTVSWKYRNPAQCW